MNIGKEIESFGYGFDTIFKECIMEKVKYEYENNKSGFKFTLYRPLGQKYVQEKMSKTELAVFNIIKKNNYVRTGEIAKIKYIERVGDDYNGYWIIVEK